MIENRLHGCVIVIVIGRIVVIEPSLVLIVENCRNSLHLYKFSSTVKLSIEIAIAK